MSTAAVLLVAAAGRRDRAGGNRRAAGRGEAAGRRAQPAKKGPAACVAEAPGDAGPFAANAAAARWGAARWATCFFALASAWPFALRPKPAARRSDSAKAGEAVKAKMETAMQPRAARGGCGAREARVLEIQHVLDFEHERSMARGVEPARRFAFRRSRVEGRGLGRPGTGPAFFEESRDAEIALRNIENEDQPRDRG